jgi:hypothetical protein
LAASQCNAKVIVTLRVIMQLKAAAVLVPSSASTSKPLSTQPSTDHAAKTCNKSHFVTAFAQQRRQRPLKITISIPRSTHALTDSMKYA